METIMLITLLGVKEFGIFRVIVFYGNLDRTLRSNYYECLRILTQGNKQSWVIVEDFNEVTLQNEQLGKNLRPE